MKIKFKLKMAMLLVAVILVGASPVMAFPGQTNACNGCHTISPSINVTTNVTSITVSPNQSFTVGISWSGGLAGTAGTTEVNWPTSFTNIGITRDNAQFNPTLRVPAPSPAGASGTTQSTLTAPATPGNYIVRVYTSSGLSPNPDGTNFSDINVTVAAPTVSVLKTITVSPSTATLNVNGTQVFNATALDQNSTPMVGVNISWTVSNSTVGNVSSVNATTDTNGTASTMFTALVTGTTMVNATSGNVTGNASVTVNQSAVVVPVLTTIMVSPSAATLNVNGTQDFTATALDQNNTPMAGVNISWAVGNSTVGNISTLNALTGMDGNVTTTFMALAVGNTTVNATNGTVSGSANVTVTAPTPVPPPKATFNISGFKIDNSTGNGIPGWNITVMNVTMQKSMLTGADGSYKFTDLVNGTYNVSEEMKTGFTPVGATLQGATINGSDVTNVNFTNAPVTVVKNGSISGNVTNASNGSAISGATVTANGMMATTDANGSYNISIAAGTYNMTASMTGYQSNTTTGVAVTAGNVTIHDFALTPTVAPTPTAPKLTLTLNNTMDGTATPLVNNITNITSAVLLDTSNNTIESATIISPDSMTAQFNLSGIIPGDYFIKVNNHAGALVPTRIDSNASDINQSVGRRLRNSVISNNSDPMLYRIKSYPSEISSSHPVVNYFNGSNESKYAFVIVPNSTSKIEVRVLNTSEELSNFSTSNLNHDSYTDNLTGLPVSFQIWILGDVKNPADTTGVAFLGNHGHLFNASTDNTTGVCSGCHPSLGTKPATFPPVTGFGQTGWCFRCHNGPGGPSQGFVDPTVAVAANGTIAGNVTNASSSLPISGATITADGMTATTDTNGSYSMSIAAGTYNVTASATGFQSNTTTGVVVTAGNVTTQDFALIPTAAPIAVSTFNISGFKINNANGSGIPGWNITLMNSTMQTSMLTDMNGSYMFTGLVNGTYNVSEEMKTGFTPVGATIQTVTINGSDVTNVNFTNNPVSAVNRTFVADLTGGEEVPPEVTLARANATFNLSDDGTVLQFKITVANITNVTASHIHLAPVGVNGSIVVNLFTGPTKVGRFDGVLAEGNITQANLTGPLAGQPFSALLDNMTNGNTYVNIHTTQHPAGEIRGQIRVAPVPNARFSISGFKINNATGNGIQDWNITLRNGATNALVDSKPTDANGFYQFIVLVNGSYNVSEEMKPGFTPTNATSMQVTVENMDVMNVNFTNMVTVTPSPPQATFNISGFKINNVTGSGVQGWNITLTNSTMQTSMPTGVDGSYMFTNLANGTYNVTEGTMAGWMNVSPMSQQVTIAGSDMMNINFTNQPPTAVTFNISGFKINDTNDNGVWNSGEMGIENWNINLLDATGVLIDRQSTDTTGFYQFTDVAPGVYNVTEEMKPGFTPTNATSMPVTVENMDVTNVNFTNQVTVTPSPQATFNISGFKINNSTGNGIQGWNITVTNATMQKSMMTGTDGSYKFTGLVNGTYNVSEEVKPGFTPVGATLQSVTIDGKDATNVNFTNMPSVSQANGNISGFKFNDINGNGMWDSVEPGLANWTIVLTIPDGSNITATTNTDGFYMFSNLSAGNYMIGEVLQPGWVRTFPTVPVRSITLLAGENVTDIDFGNMQVPPPQATFSISGFKVNDTDGNGMWDQGEMGIEGWNIMLLDDKGTQIASTSTNPQGFYEFTNLTPGTYNVTEEMKEGFTPTSATSQVVTIKDMNVTDVNFLNMVTVTPPPQATFNISGFKVNDTDGDGVWDQGEMGIEGWNIMLLDDKGTQIASTSTNSQGFYEFMNLAPGTYKVTEEMKEGFTPSSATSKEVTIKDMDITDVNFLNHVTVTPPPVTNTISGFKINDLNGNGKQDQGENGLPGWKIKLTGIVGMGTETKAINLETTTNADGFYMFDNLPAGSYIVTEELQGGFVPVGSIVKNIILADGENSENNNFFNQPVESIIPDTSNG